MCVSTCMYVFMHVCVCAYVCMYYVLCMYTSDVLELEVQVGISFHVGGRKQSQDLCKRSWCSELLSCLSSLLN